MTGHYDLPWIHHYCLCDRLSWLLSLFSFRSQFPPYPCQRHNALCTLWCWLVVVKCKHASMLHFPCHHNKKGTDFSIPFFSPCWFLYKFNFSFRSKATISERSVTDNNPIRCVTTHLWAKAVALDGLGCFAPFFMQK